MRKIKIERNKKIQIIFAQKEQCLFVHILYGLQPENTTYKVMVEIAEQLAETLELLHSYGIYHRDLKAENMMIYLVHKRTGEVIQEAPSSFLWWAWKCP